MNPNKNHRSYYRITVTHDNNERDANPPRRRNRPSHPWEDFRFPTSVTASRPRVQPPPPLPPRAVVGEGDHRLLKTSSLSMPPSATSKENSNERQSAVRRPGGMPARKFGGSESKNHVPPVISVPLQQQQHCHVQSLGPPHLQIFRVSLPIHLRAKLPPIVSACEQYAASTRNGWETNLYSLTKQDIPLSDVPNGMRLVAEVQECILSTVQRL